MPADRIDPQIGEFATDYVEVRRDYTDWTPAYSDNAHGAPLAAGDRHGHAERSASASEVKKGDANGDATKSNGAALPATEEKDESHNGHLNGNAGITDV